MKHPSIDYNGRRFYRFPSGYWGSPHPKPTVYLHRFVWEEANGSIPEGYEIHHRDQDRGNNAPKNLELVSRSDHMKSRHKGQMPCGEASVRAKLTEAQVLEIRATYVKGRHGGAPGFAQRYGVSERCIRHIVLGETWQHIECLPEPPRLPDYCRNGHAYTPENTYVHPDGERNCRICQRRGHRDLRARRRAKRAAELKASEPT